MVAETEVPKTVDQCFEDFMSAVYQINGCIYALAKAGGEIGPINRHAMVANERIGEAHYWATQILLFAKSSMMEKMQAAAAQGKLKVMDGGDSNG